jgi:YVTN family beta-propeller protein
MKKYLSLLTISAITLFFVSCEKDDAPFIETPVVTKGLYILGEGGYGSNNTTLTYYDLTTSTAVTDFYKNVNGSSLGDTGNDMIIYGGKIYIVMNGSSYVAVANAFTGKQIDTVSFRSAGGGAVWQPRFAVGYKNKVYVSNFNGTVSVIDTTSLKVENNITVGTNPEKLAVVGSSLYVVNSGMGADSTVSVIDLNTHTEVKKIVVGINPFDIAANSAGDIYVTTRSLWNNAAYKPQISVIDSKTNTVKATLDHNISAVAIEIANDTAYLYGGYASTPNVISLLDTKTNNQIKSSFVTDGSTVKDPYGLSVDPTNGDVYVLDANGYVSAGIVYCFDKAGKKKFSFSITPGLNPNKLVFIQ